MHPTKICETVFLTPADTKWVVEVDEVTIEVEPTLIVVPADKVEIDVVMLADELVVEVLTSEEVVELPAEVTTDEPVEIGAGCK